MRTEEYLIEELKKAMADSATTIGGDAERNEGRRRCERLDGDAEMEEEVAISNLG